MTEAELQDHELTARAHKSSPCCNVILELAQHIRETTLTEDERKGLAYALTAFAAAEFDNHLDRPNSRNLAKRLGVLKEFEHDLERRRRGCLR